jgi:hypothetical protein
VLATAALFAALVLPLWVMKQATADSPPAAQPAAAVNTGGLALGRGAGDASGVGEGQRDREREREREEEGERD